MSYTHAALSGTLTLDIQTLQHGMKAAIKRAYTTVVQKVEEFIATYFPKDTGTLRRNTKVRLIFQDPDYEIEIVCDPVSPTGEHYASHVNAMAGVDWTWPTTVDHFFTKLGDRLYTWIVDALKAELGAVQAGNIGVSYVGD